MPVAVPAQEHVGLEGVGTTHVQPDSALPIVVVLSVVLTPSSKLDT